MTDAFRPIPEDPSGEEIVEFFDVRAEDWILSAQGDYATAAAETMREDGSGYQRVVVLQWPGRRNHSDERVTVRLLMSPDDAEGLAAVLARTARWLRAADTLAN